MGHNVTNNNITNTNTNVNNTTNVNKTTKDNDDLNGEHLFNHDGNQTASNNGNNNKVAIGNGNQVNINLPSNASPREIKEYSKSIDRLQGQMFAEKEIEHEHRRHGIFHDISHGIGDMCRGLGHVACGGLRLAVMGEMAPELLAGRMVDSMMLGGMGGGMSREMMMPIAMRSASEFMGPFGSGPGMLDSMLGTPGGGMLPENEYNPFISPGTNMMDNRMNGLSNDATAQMENTFKITTKLEMLKTILGEMSKIIGMAASSDSTIEQNYQ